MKLNSLAHITCGILGVEPTMQNKSLKVVFNVRDLRRSFCKYLTLMTSPLKLCISSYRKLSLKKTSKFYFRKVDSLENEK